MTEFYHLHVLSAVNSTSHFHKLLNQPEGGVRLFDVLEVSESYHYFFHTYLSMHEAYDCSGGPHEMEGCAVILQVTLIDITT